MTVIGCKLKNANEGCNSCASLVRLVLCFIACFILLVIAPLYRWTKYVRRGMARRGNVRLTVVGGQRQMFVSPGSCMYRHATPSRLAEDSSWWHLLRSPPFAVLHDVNSRTP